jgi:hypothetical protein
MRTTRMASLAVAALVLCGEAYGQARSTKRGVAFGYHTPADMNAMKSGISWWYNWAPVPDPGIAGTFPNSEVAFMPMVWGGQFTVADMVARIPAGAQYLLTFNEPNFVPQAHLTPQQMAALWPQIEQIATQRNLTIVSPAVNFCGGADCTLPGVTDPDVYLDQFFAACTNCRVDHIAVHWYACHRDALVWYLDKFRKYGRPIWVTEIACWEGNPTLQQQRDYMPQAVDVLENDPMVFRYAWFSGDRAVTGTPYVSLYAPASGQLTELGQLYRSLPFNAGTPMPTPTATATPAPGTLLSSNRPASASSAESAGTAASLAVDGNTGTRWSSAFSDPQWISVDLGTTASITRVRLNWEAAYATAYQIQVSANDSTWTTILNVTGGNGGIDDHNVSTSGRYIRVYGTARATTWGYSLWELEVYGAATTPRPTATATATARPTTRATATATATVRPTSTTRPTATPTAVGTGTSVNLSSAFNVNVAYTDGATFPANGGIDGVGSAYSSTLLGASLTWSGATFTLGPANQTNGARNRTVTLPAGSFTTLLLLGTGEHHVHTDVLELAERIAERGGPVDRAVDGVPEQVDRRPGQPRVQPVRLQLRAEPHEDGRQRRAAGHEQCLDPGRDAAELTATGGRGAARRPRSREGGRGASPRRRHRPPRPPSAPRGSRRRRTATSC